MENTKAQTALLVRALTRPVAVLWLALSLSACVTLPGAPNANTSGSPGDLVQTSISSGVSALTDFFSSEVREFKKLVTEESRHNCRWRFIRTKTVVI